jgi:hypothetical protein
VCVRCKCVRGVAHSRKATGTVSRKEPGMIYGASVANAACAQANDLQAQRCALLGFFSKNPESAGTMYGNGLCAVANSLCSCRARAEVQEMRQ